MPEPRAEQVGNRLANLQMAFAAHLRNPEKFPAPEGLEDRRLQIYRDLFFNNVSKLLAGNFPVLKKIYSDAAWQQLIRDFYTEHRAHTPLFPELPKEFLRYVQEQRAGNAARAGDPPFLLELAHYEWVELALSLDMHELDEVHANPAGDLLQGIPVLSPLAWPLVYRFPVHRISPDYKPQEAPAEPTRLLAYRNRKDQVKFMEINPVTWLLLEKLQGADKTGLDILQAIAGEIGHTQPGQVIEHGRKLLLDLIERDESYAVKAEMPGVRKEDIDIRVDGNLVTISAEMKKEKEEKKEGRVLRRERQEAYASRSFTLACPVDDGKAEAKFVDGVLELTLPKKAPTSTKRLTIS